MAREKRSALRWDLKSMKEIPKFKEGDCQWKPYAAGALDYGMSFGCKFKPKAHSRLNRVGFIAATENRS